MKGRRFLYSPSAEKIIAVPPMTSSKISSSLAGPSKISNPGTSISACASTSSSMAPPGDPPRRTFGKSTFDFARQKAYRPLTSEQKAAASSSSRPSTAEAGSSTNQVKPYNHPASSVSLKNKLPAPSANPKPSEDDVIEISSDSHSDSPPPPPKRDIPKTARKSTGGNQPRRTLPPKRKSHTEIIEIFDSDDEMAKPQVATGKSVVLANATGKIAKVSENTFTSKPPAEDGMDVDHSSGAPAEVDAPRAGIADRNPAVPDMAVDLQWTPSPPSKPEAEPATPAQPSLQQQPGSSLIKKTESTGLQPNFHPRRYHTSTFTAQTTPPNSSQNCLWFLQTTRNFTFAMPCLIARRRFRIR